ncbi:MAG: adenylate/guanylate cyclase domain-containing protein [Pseudomonadales bacterium]|nr:adenylate/guanylate cyclase domain-containing protein [Pseudomonadales bacterium]
MSKLDNTIEWLFPKLILEQTPWLHMWQEDSNAIFCKNARIFLPIAIVGYIAHYFFFDRALGLEPLDLWFKFRFSVAALAFVCFLFYLSPLSQRWYYKLPLLITWWTMCYLQARVLIWYPEADWIWVFAFTISAVWMLRATALNSTIIAGCIITTQVPSLIEFGLTTPDITSGIFATIAIVVIIRSSYISEIRNFLLAQKNIEAQKKIIELNVEFSDRLRTFIPRVIAERLEQHITDDHMSVLQASIEVLEPRVVEVACLFSDIRGYTSGSKELKSYVTESVLPDVKVCSDAVEEQGGIPRKVGDLLFAYFDEKEPDANLLRALLAGLEISRCNQDLNSTSSSHKIRRYILISIGEAIVGNLGGLDSSVEITALGPPVNFLSRLDDLTKNPSLSTQLETGDLLLSESSVNRLINLDVPLEMTPVMIAQLGLTIRDFPGVTTIYRMKPTDFNHESLNQALSKFYLSSQRLKNVQLASSF